MKSHESISKEELVERLDQLFDLYLSPLLLNCLSAYRKEGKQLSLKYHHPLLLKIVVAGGEIPFHEMEDEDREWLLLNGYLVSDNESNTLLPTQPALVLVRYLQNSPLLDADFIKGWDYFIEQVLLGRLAFHELKESYEQALRDELRRLFFNIRK